MHAVKINNTLLHIPAQWDELNRHYLELIAGLSRLNFDEYAFKTHLLFHGAGIYLKKLSPGPNPADKTETLYQVRLADKSTAFLTPNQVAELGNLFNFLFKTEEEDGQVLRISLESRLTRQLIPRFKVGPTYYYGPSDKLFNITLSEFIHAENNLKRYAQEKDIRHLDKLIAILYRPQDNSYDPDAANYKGDRRTPFNDHRFEERADKFRKLTPNIKTCIYLWYTGCQWWYQQKFPHVFSKKSAGEDNGLGFLNLIDALTGGDVSKTDEIRRTLLMDVMVHLERAALDYEEMEKKLNKA